jgi:hypothetical protein
VLWPPALRHVSFDRGQQPGEEPGRDLNWRGQALKEEDSQSTGTSTTCTSTTSISWPPPDFRLVIFVWSVGLVYVLFDDQLMAPGAVEQCSLASSWSSALHPCSVAMALPLPLLLGPGLAALLHRAAVALEQAKLVVRRSPSQASIHQSSPTSPAFTLQLIFIHLACYSTNMLLADMLYPTHIDVLFYMILKYCIGFSFLIAFPIAVLVSHPEVALT